MTDLYASKWVRLFCLLTLHAFLIACNKPPLASAGNDVSGFERNHIILKGSASDEDKGSTLSYHWQQTSGNAVDNLEGAHSLTPTITLPPLSAEETYTFQLTVTDSAGETASDEITVTAYAYTTLKSMKFQNTALQRCAKTNLVHLAFLDMGYAKALNCSNLAIDQLTGLEQTPNILKIALFNNQLTDLSPLQHTPKLTLLDLNNNQITSTQQLGHLHQLQQLNMANNQVSDLSRLDQLTALQSLNLSWNRLNNHQLKQLLPLKQLKELHLNNNNLSSIHGLEQLTSLEKLYLHNTQLKDLSPLYQLPNLKQVTLSGKEQRLSCRSLNRLQKHLGNEASLIKPKRCFPS